MTFTDISFLFIFLPIALLLYHLAGGKLQEVILLLTSLLFYACGSFWWTGALALSLLWNVGVGMAISRFKERKAVAVMLLVAGVLSNVAVLVYYKYFNFIVETTNAVFHTSFAAREILLPLGLSFYTFKAVSYLADSYRGKIDGGSPITAALYLSFFGQMQSGPIARCDTFFAYSQSKKRKILAGGGTKFLTGFCKKVLLSNVLSNIVIEVFDGTETLTTSLAWLGAVCYSLQLYYDFSGYSDMAIGIGEMFGYECPENFNYPYMSKSVSEFWRRWHITLGAWFRDYIYIPLGGSRVGKPRLIWNLFVVWSLTGLWHGANWTFIIWGIVYFLLIAFEKLTGLPGRVDNKLFSAFWHIVTLLIVNFQWVLFRSADLAGGAAFIKAMLIPAAAHAADARAIFLLGDYAVFIVAAVLFAMPVVPCLRAWCKKRTGTDAAYQITSAIVLAIGFVISLSLVVSGQNNPFLYANF